METEYDLHKKPVNFIKNRYPKAENQTTSSNDTNHFC